MVSNTKSYHPMDVTATGASISPPSLVTGATTSVSESAINTSSSSIPVSSLSASLSLPPPLSGGSGSLAASFSDHSLSAALSLIQLLSPPFNFTPQDVTQFLVRQLPSSSISVSSPVSSMGHLPSPTTSSSITVVTPPLPLSHNAAAPYTLSPLAQIVNPNLSHATFPYLDKILTSQSNLGQISHNPTPNPPLPAATHISNPNPNFLSALYFWTNTPQP